MSPSPRKEHVARVAQDRRYVRCNEILAIAQADYHRRPQAGSHDFVRVRTGDHAQREHARKVPHCPAHRFFQVALVVFLHQVRDHFGVGLGDKLVALELELLFELPVVFDDAVVDHHDVAGAIAMRMCIFLAWTPVGGPNACGRCRKARPQDLYGARLRGCAVCRKPGAPRDDCRR